MTRVSGRSRNAPRARQQRIVGQHGADADADGVDFGPNALRVPVGRVRGQRRARARAPRAMQPSRLIAALSMTNGRRSRISVKNGWLRQVAVAAPRPTSTATPCSLEKREAPAAHQRIRILDRRHDARDAGLDDPHDAGPGPPDVTARFERAVQRRALRAARPASSSAFTSACGSPARAW